MTDSVISADGVGKEYVIGTRGTAYQTMRESIMAVLSDPLGRIMTPKSASRANDRFWAVQDVSFEVRSGEVLGIIGRNGAGKSTLLKILSRITEPTVGTVRIKGRVASLLEVGTGFHPELTGRENIFLNGAILGMSRAEIRRKFDEIADFAEIERFLDTPVKRYSSGMYVRLAFAVAASLDSEILLVDEVLAVGDIAFQRKCLDRVKDLSSGQRTVVFVSHNNSAIRMLCDRCMLIEQGRLVTIGPTSEVLETYVSRHVTSSDYSRSKPASAQPHIVKASLTTDLGLANGRQLVARVNIEMASEIRTRLAIGLRIKDQIGSSVGFGSLGHFNSEDLIDVAPGTNHFEIGLPLDHLALGEYLLTIRVAVPHAALIEEIEDCLALTVDRPPRAGMTRSLPQSWGYGSVEFPLQRLDPLRSAGSQTHDET